MRLLWRMCVCREKVNDPNKGAHHSVRRRGARVARTRSAIYIQLHIYVYSYAYRNRRNRVVVASGCGLVGENGRRPEDGGQGEGLWSNLKYLCVLLRLINVTQEW